MLEKIHCDLLDVYGVDWTNINDEQVECIVSTIHGMELVGEKDDLFGFVGTTNIDGVIGGFFVIQFPTEFLSYVRDKTAIRKTTTPAERVFFVLFPKNGRVLLQNRRFQILPIDMELIHIRFKEALSRVLRTCNVGPIVSLIPTSVDVTRSDLLSAYESSRCVSRLQVTHPDARQIPEDFVYHNPERERNKILRDSRLHDYPKLRQIGLIAKRHFDLRDTHLGQDLVHATRDNTRFLMEFEDKDYRHRILRRLVKPKFEFHVDISGEEVSRETLLQVLEIVHQEASLNISLPPTIESPDQQPKLF